MDIHPAKKCSSSLPTISTHDEIGDFISPPVCRNRLGLDPKLGDLAGRDPNAWEGQGRSFGFRPAASTKEAGTIAVTEYSIQLTDFPSFTTSNLIGLRYRIPAGIVGRAAKYPSGAISVLTKSLIIDQLHCLVVIRMIQHEEYSVLVL